MERAMRVISLTPRRLDTLTLFAYTDITSNVPRDHDVNNDVQEIRSKQKKKKKKKMLLLRF